MSIALMTSVPLTAGYQASNPFVMVSDACVIHAGLVVTVGAATVTFYLEFSDDLVTWYREVAEEDAGGGVVLMPEVIRTFADNGGLTLAIGTHNLSCQFVRRAKFARVQIASANTVQATLTAPYGNSING